ncbi:MFS transporter [Carboxydochorda subterranea]|uniref:MFS transporter n=1 Tax=Carboxydichorda subterranea TaxID=3109565 RepID=A0ABZ1BVA2_9FIRM|nr:MFS transporter [Limnochorda sp. L945t]WRP16057.1 MFS transporter [Limnochorda sp. L945t]
MDQDKSFTNFLVVWGGQLVSSIGSGMTAFSLVVYAFERTRLATNVALITLLSFLPSILLRPIGGVLADRFDRRAMMIIGDLGSASGVVFILLTMLFGDVDMWHIYAGVTVSSIFVALQSPAYKASATDWLTEEQYSKGSGLVQLAESSKFLLSPFIAGTLFSFSNIETVLAVDIGTFVVAVFAVLVIKKQMKRSEQGAETGHWMKDLAEGWRAIVSNRGVALLILVISVVTFYLGFLQTLIGPMVLSFADARTLGTIQSVSAVGMLISSMLIGMFSMGHRYMDMLVIGLVIAGLALSLMGVTTNVHFIIAAGFLFLSALPFVNASADVLIRRNIPNDKQGRVWGIIGILSQLGFIVAYGISGLLADHVFNPFLEEGGLLASSVGHVIGTGPGRGIGLMFIIAGILVVVMALITSGVRPIRALATSASVVNAGGSAQ